MNAYTTDTVKEYKAKFKKLNDLKAVSDKFGLEPSKACGVCWKINN